MSQPTTASVRFLSGQREPVRVATVGPMDLYGLETIDGVALSVGDRVLVKDQDDPRENGIYTAAHGRWYRASDASFSRAITKGVTVAVQAGTINAGRTWSFVTINPNIGVDGITLSLQVSGGSGGGAEPETAQQILQKLKTVDGPGSGLDADLLDGFSSAYYRDLANATGRLNVAQLPEGYEPGGGGTDPVTAQQVLDLLVTVDGAGSNLDADLLDGQSGAYYLDLSNATGQLTDDNMPDSYTPGGGAGGGGVDAATVTEAQGKFWSANKPSMLVAGNTAAGDMGVPLLFIRRTTQPTHLEKFQSADGAWWERVKPAGRGFLPDKGNGATIHRFQDRVFIGDAAKKSSGTSSPTDPHTWLQDADGVTGPGHYLERGAMLFAMSPNGGIAGTFGTRLSEQYTYYGYQAWKSGESVPVGAKRGYFGRLYTSTTSGTTGPNSLQHQSGTASDGAVTWQFDGFNYMTPIGLAAVGLSDAVDGHAVWALYNEVEKRATGGTAFAREVAVKNKGGNAINGPYQMLPGGATIGDWFAGGGDAAVGAPAAPSTCAILIGKNSTTWNKGIVFGSDGLTGATGTSGFGIAISMARGHVIEWQTTENAPGGSITSVVTANAQRVAISMENDAITVLGRDQSLLRVGYGGGSGTFISVVGGTSNPQVKADGPSSNYDLTLLPKGTGVLRLGTPFSAASTPGNFQASRFFQVRDSAGTAYYIPCHTFGW